MDLGRNRLRVKELSAMTAGERQRVLATDRDALVLRYSPDAYAPDPAGTLVLGFTAAGALDDADVAAALFTHLLGLPGWNDTEVRLWACPAEGRDDALEAWLIHHGLVFGTATAVGLDAGGLDISGHLLWGPRLPWCGGR